MVTILLYKLIIVLGIVGLLLSNHIFTNKKSKKKLICPLRSNCEKVVKSNYATLYGIPLEVLGMYYYGGTSLLYALAVGFYMPASVFFFLFWVSLSGVIFSLYLIALQAFVLKDWCVWCLGSAGISILIGLSSYLAYFVF